MPDIQYVHGPSEEYSVPSHLAGMVHRTGPGGPSHTANSRRGLHWWRWQSRLTRPLREIWLKQRQGPKFRQGHHKLKDVKIKVQTLITDLHVQIKKWVRENIPETLHCFDVWHVAKGEFTKRKFLFHYHPTNNQI